MIFIMIDGQYLDATDFIEIKEGIWIPKKYEDNGKQRMETDIKHIGTGTASSSTSQGTTAQTNIGHPWQW